MITCDRCGERARCRTVFRREWDTAGKFTPQTQANETRWDLCDDCERELSGRLLAVKDEFFSEPMGVPK